MEYITLAGRRLLFIVAIAVFLILSVIATFGFIRMRFGSARLTTILSRTTAAEFDGIYYSLAFGLFDRIRPPPDARNARAIPALLYHSIGTGRELVSLDGYTVAASNFAAQMKTLHDAGWQTITYQQFDGFMRGSLTLPERSFLLTFDDGSKASFYPVDPILAALNMHALTFILPKYSLGPGSDYYLSRGELAALIENGRWEIGSHSEDGHHLAPIDAQGDMEAALAAPLWLPDLGRVETEAEYERRIASDLSISRYNLEQALGVSVPAFAFPLGEYGQKSEVNADATTTSTRIADGIYRAVFYQVRRGEAFSYNYPTPGKTDLILGRRIEPTPEVMSTDLLALLERGMPKDLPFTDDFSTDTGWRTVWGPYAFTPGEARLAATGDETGSAIVLDGTRDWKDYRMHATVNSPRGSGVYIWLRYQDGAQYAGCSFGNGFIHAESTVNGNLRVIKGTEGSTIPSGDFVVEASVHGREITCTLGNRSVTSEFLDPALDQGGIGIKTWEPPLNTARLIVRRVDVEPMP